MQIGNSMPRGYTRSRTTLGLENVATMAGGGVPRFARYWMREANFRAGNSTHLYINHEVNNVAPNATARVKTIPAKLGLKWLLRLMIVQPIGACVRYSE
jgi:hypothetical protein